MTSALKQVSAPDLFYKKSFFTILIHGAESDELVFRHAGKCGAKVFDGVKVTSINFIPDSTTERKERPVSAAYQVKSDGTTGEIKFEYIVYVHPYFYTKKLLLDRGFPNSRVIPGANPMKPQT